MNEKEPVWKDPNFWMAVGFVLLTIIANIFGLVYSLKFVSELSLIALVLPPLTDMIQDRKKK